MKDKTSVEAHRNDCRLQSIYQLLRNSSVFVSFATVLIKNLLFCLRNPDSQNQACL